jgi:maleylpyruvate isomerase
MSQQRPQLFTQSRNSAGERVRIALHLKAIDYEYVAVSAMDPDAYRAVNPQGLMPALRIGETVIAQSSAILEYLEETCPARPLLPSDALTRAQARAFAQLIACDTHPLCNYRVRKYLVQAMGASDAAISAWYQNWVRESFAALEETLARRGGNTAFCFGDEPGWADLHLVPIVANARRFACDLAPYRRLTEIEARCTPLDAFRRARPDAQPDYAGRVDTVLAPGGPG